MQIQKQSFLSPEKYSESILVIPRNVLFPDDTAWHGFKKVNPESYVELINQHKEFIPRGVAETDPSYKQIIPYIIFTYNNNYFLMQRSSTATEKRLADKYTLGIGGHLREEDMEGTTLVEWAQREFNEEINYTGTLSVTPLGIINDDSNDVGKVHAGFVFLLEGDSNCIRIKSELKNGRLCSLQECKKLYPKLETWSQMMVDYLLEAK